LENHAYVCREAGTGSEALILTRQERPDLVLLDAAAPLIGGARACEMLRRESDAHIIALSTQTSERAKVAVLDAGADDYVTKPFSSIELLARIRAALRGRAPLGGRPARFVSPELEIDFEARTAKLRGGSVRLTPKQAELLRVLTAQAGKPVPHSDLLRAVWGPRHSQEVEYLRVFVNQIRKKLERDPARPETIMTTLNVGYRFVPGEGGRMLSGPALALNAM
jgi:two-component system KDP operon response regulator KdpE